MISKDELDDLKILADWIEDHGGPPVLRNLIPRIEKLGYMVTTFQKTTADIVYNENRRYGFLREVVRWMELRGPEVLCLADHPKVRFEDVESTSPPYKRIPVIELRQRLAFDRMPPELVAREIAAKMEIAILERWQDQSVLTLGTQKPAAQVPPASV